MTEKGGKEPFSLLMTIDQPVCDDQADSESGGGDGERPQGHRLDDGRLTLLHLSSLQGGVLSQQVAQSGLGGVVLLHGVPDTCRGPVQQSQPRVERKLEH